MKNKLYKITLTNDISYLIISIYFLILLGASSDGWYRYTSLALLFLWVFIVILTDKIPLGSIWKNKAVKAFVYFYSYYTFTSLISVFITGDLIYILKINLTILLDFSPLFIFCYYKDKNKVVSIRLLKTIFIIFFYYIIKAIIFYYKYPYAGRIINDYGYDGMSVALGGGYNLAYASVMLVLFLFTLLMDKEIHGRKQKILILIMVVVLLLLIITTGSTITILATFFGLLFAFLLRYPNYSRRNYVKSDQDHVINMMRVFVFITIVIITIVNLTTIGEWIMAMANNQEGIVASRFSEFGAKIAYGSAAGGQASGFDTRINLIKKSLTAFLSSPVFGLGYLYGYNPTLGQTFGVATHSEFADSLAKYGIAGSIPLFFTYYYILKYTKALFSWRLLPLVIALSIMTISNPFISFQPNLVLFYLIPSVCYVIGRTGI